MSGAGFDAGAADAAAADAAPGVAARLGRARLQAFLAWYHEDLRLRAAQGAPVVFLQFGGNVREIFEALDFGVSYPCISSILSGVDGSAATAIARAEAEGYGSTACALMKADLGRRLQVSAPGHLRVLGGGAPVVTPSLLVCPHAGCSTYIKWYEALADVTAAPLVLLDVPPRRTDGIPAADLRYVVEQLQDLARLAERLAGRTLDLRRLAHILARSRSAERRWLAFLRQNRTAPAAFDALAEGTPVMAPVFLARGRAETVGFYQGLLADLARRPARRPERFRVLFDGPPPWPAMDLLSDELARWDARVVAATYPRIGGVFDAALHDPGRPFESMARHAMGCWNGLDLDLRRDWLLRWAREYRVDAVILHAVASCKGTAVGQADARGVLEAAGLPVLLLQSDIIDARYFQAAPTRNRIDAFFHALGGRAAWRSGGPVGHGPRGEVAGA